MKSVKQILFQVRDGAKVTNIYNRIYFPCVYIDGTFLFLGENVHMNIWFTSPHNAALSTNFVW